MEPWQIIGLVIGGILAAAGAVNTVGAAVEKIIKALKAAHAPDAEQDRRITALEEATTELQREAERLRKRLDDRDDGMTIMYKAILALLGHGIDGNNLDEMRTAKSEIQNYLINK